MKILIVYRDCSLQEALAHQFKQRGYAVLCITPEEVADLLQGRFAEALAAGDDDAGWIVVDCASRALDPEGQPALDEAAFQGVVGFCAQRHWPLLMVSDSRVFPSGSKQRYREVDAPQPAVLAGIVLARREQYLADHCPRHLVLRTGPLIASDGNNLLTAFLQRLRGGEVMAVANGARFCPTPAADLARVIVGICDQLGCNVQSWGIYHYHSSDPTTGYEFAEVLLAAAMQYWELDAARTRLQLSIDDPLGSLYPLLNCQRIRDTFGIQQLPWRKAIPQLLKTIHAGETS